MPGETLYAPWRTKSKETELNSYGTAKSGVGISAMAVLRPDLMMKCVVPVVMAGIVGVRYLAKLSLYIRFDSLYRSTDS